MKLCNLKRSLKGCDLLEATFGVNLYRHLIQILIQMAHSTICSLFLSLPLSKVFFFSTFAFGNLITGWAFRPVLLVPNNLYSYFLHLKKKANIFFLGSKDTKFTLD